MHSSLHHTLTLYYVECYTHIPCLHGPYCNRRVSETRAKTRRPIYVGYWDRLLPFIREIQPHPTKLDATFNVLPYCCAHVARMLSPSRTRFCTFHHVISFSLLQLSSRFSQFYYFQHRRK